MANIGRNLLLVFFAGTLNYSIAQDCFDYYLNSCSGPESKYNYSLNNSSVSFLFKSGEEKNIPFSIYSGKDYRITLCADMIFDNIIHFRLVREDGEVLYDNSSDNYNLHVEFSCVKSRDVTIELKAPSPSAGTADTVYYEGCIGLLIEDMVSVKTGF